MSTARQHLRFFATRTIGLQPGIFPSAGAGHSPQSLGQELCLSCPWLQVADGQFQAQPLRGPGQTGGRKKLHFREETKIILTQQNVPRAAPGKADICSGGVGGDGARNVTGY